MADARASSNVDRMLGAKLRLRRVELGMSQEQLAALLGVTFQQVQKYEKGVNRLAAGRLYEAAIALDMPVARFFSDLPAGKSADISEQVGETVDLLGSPEAMELLRLFSQIKHKGVRRRVVELVRAMSASD